MPKTFDILIILTSPPDKQIAEISGAREIIRRFRCLCVCPPYFIDDVPEPFDKARSETGSVSDENAVWERAKAILLFQPSLPFLAGIATGAGNDAVSMGLAQALVSGKPILGIGGDAVMRPFASDSKLTERLTTATEAARAREAFESLYRQYIRTLGGWGVSWVEPEDLYKSIERLMGGSPGRTESTSPPAPKQRLIITGDDVMERVRRGEKEWRLPPDAIITDIAREIAEKHGFKMGKS